MVKPKIALIPSAFKTSSLKPQLGTDFTVSRNSEASRINSDGFLEFVGANVPRLDYTFTSYPELLIENESTNELKYSEDFTQSDWTKNNVTVSGSQYNHITNRNDATKLTNSGTTDSYLRQTFSTGSGSSTFSVYAKKGSLDIVELRCLSLTSLDPYAQFDLRNGEVLFVETGYSAKIIELRDGWYRLIMTMNGALSNYSIHAGKSNDDSGGFVYIYGAQIELKNNESSYIKTTTASLTRPKEVVTSSNIGTSSEGVLFVKSKAIDTGTSRLISISDGSLSNYIYIEYRPTSGRVAGAFSGISFLEHIIGDTSVPLNIAFRYKANDFSLWINGVKVAESLSGNLDDVTLNRLNFCSYDNSSDIFESRVSVLQYYDTYLSDKQMKELIY